MSDYDFMNLTDSDSDSEVRSIVLGDLTDTDEAEDRIQRAEEKKRKLKKLKDAQAELKKFVEEENKAAQVQRLEKVLKKKKKQANMSEPRFGSGLMSAAQRKEALDNVDEIFDKASREIAKIVAATMVEHGFEKPSKGVPPKTAPGRVPLDLKSEAELEVLVKPECLRGGEWQTAIGSFPSTLGELIGHKPEEQLLILVKKLYNGMEVLNAKLNRVMDIQHLHTVASINVVKTSNLLRVLCLADGMEKDAIYQKLQNSLRTVALASDGDLKELPLPNLAALEAFFSDEDRIQKLGYFLLCYTEYSKTFAADLTNTLLSGDLQHECFWSIGIQAKKGYVTAKWKDALGTGYVRIPRSRSLPADTAYLPIYVQMFIIKVAKAAFEYANVNTKEKFNQPAFCKEMKKLLYNTTRNEKRRESNNKQAPGAAKNSKPEEVHDIAGDDSEDTTALDETPKRALPKMECYVGLKRIRTESPTKTVKDDVPTPVIKRSKGVGRGQSSALDQLLGILESGGGRDVLIATLHGIIKDTPSRRNLKKPIEQATELLLKLSNGADDDDLNAIVSDYHDALTKL